MAMASGIVEPRNSNVSSTVNTANYAPQTQGSRSPRMKLQRFDTAPEDPFGLDGANDSEEEESRHSVPQQAYSLPRPQSQSQSQPQLRSEPEQSQPQSESPEAQRRNVGRTSTSTYSIASKLSIPPPGSVLTGKQEHCTLLTSHHTTQTPWPGPALLSGKQTRINKLTDMLSQT